MLPYVNTELSPRGLDFYEGSAFIDYRSKDLDLDEIKDPLYLDDDEFVMKPWTTPLSSMSNDGTVLVYCANTDHIFMTTQATTSTSDPILTEDSDFTGVTNENYETDRDDQSYEGDESTFWQRRNGRDAQTVLKDIKLWYERMLVLPGGGEHSDGMWDLEQTRPLYQQHGWPSDSFDGDGFVVSLLRADASAQGPEKHPDEKKIQQTRDRIAFLSSEKTMEHMTDAITRAKDLDQEWTERYKLWQAKYRKRQAEELLSFQMGGHSQSRAAPALSAQESAPFWEMERMRQGAEDAEELISELLEGESGDEEESGSTLRKRQLALKQALTDKSMYWRGFEQCREECQAKHPMMTFTEATGMQYINQFPQPTAEEQEFERKQTEEEIAALEAWAAAEIPEEAAMAKDEVAFYIERLKDRL